VKAKTPDDTGSKQRLFSKKPLDSKNLYLNHIKVHVIRYWMVEIPSGALAFEDGEAVFFRESRGYPSGQRG
jgi:hypothetical protein